MDTYTLYSMQTSGNCYKPRLLLHQLGIPFRLVEMDSGRGETRTPEFLALNPNGRVPFLILPDGRRLAESNAMLLYLAEGSRYLPANRYDRGVAAQWLFFEQYDHEPQIAVARSWL
jgi:glutathione S-transferase